MMAVSKGAHLLLNRVPGFGKIWHTGALETTNGKEDAFMVDKCKYCGSTAYGSGCLNSPHKKHEHVGDEQHCIFCGSTAYGSGCLNSPHKKHQHGSSGNKCVYCGSTATGSGCLNSPVGKHMK